MEELTISMKSKSNAKKSVISDHQLRITFHSGNKNWKARVSLGATNNQTNSPCLKPNAEKNEGRIRKKITMKDQIEFANEASLVREFVKEKKNGREREPMEEQDRRDGQLQTLKNNSSLHQVGEKKAESAGNQVEALHERVSKLIEAKIKRLNKDYGKIQNVRWTVAESDEVKDELDAELEEIFLELQQIKASDSQDIHEEISVYDRKINVLEKLMAEEMAVSEILKKMYMSQLFKNKKKNKNSGHKISNHLRNGLFHTLSSPWMRSSSLNNEESKFISFQTTNKSSFTFPPAEFYREEKAKKKIVLPDFQPVARSTYGRDYLNYGVVENMSYQEKNNELLPTTFKNYTKESMYKSQFGSKKKAEKVNFRELDSFRDKFKNLKFSYNLDDKENQPNGPPNTFREKNPFNYSSLHTTDNKNMRNLTMKTENSFNFQKPTSKIASKIKDKELERMKYSFKSLMKA